MAQMRYKREKEQKKFSTLSYINRQVPTKFYLVRTFREER